MTLEVEKITKVNGVEPIGSHLPSQYQHLVQLSPDLIKEMGKKSIDILFLDFGIAEGQLRLQNKKLSHELRVIEREQQTAKVEQKLAEYNRFAPIFTAGLAGMAAIGGAFAGGRGTDFGQAISQAVSTTGNQFDMASKGRVERYDHQYQIAGSLIQDHSQDLHRETQEFDRALSAIDRAHQAFQRTLETMASAAV